MIGDWIKYITDMLASAVRGSVLVQFISALLSPSKTAQDSLNAYLSDARLRSAATWQACWLEKLLSDNLGYMVTITEASGLPVDFVVTGVSYTDAARASALLNRYKLAGRSYILEFSDVAVVAQWDNALCEKTALINLYARWDDALCEKVETLLRVVDQSGSIVVYLSYDPEGNLPAANTFYVTYPGSTVTVQQISASVDGSPVPTNAYANIQILSNVNPSKKQIAITVDTNATGLEREWVFRFESGTATYDLTINQLAQ